MLTSVSLNSPRFAGTHAPRSRRPRPSSAWGVPSPLSCLILLATLAGALACSREQAEHRALESAPTPESSGEPGPTATTAPTAKIQPPEQAPAAVSHRYQRAYTFSEDWFSNRIPTWERILRPLAGKPLAYLEVGLFEGRSALWMLENILTHPDSRLTGVDLFTGTVKQTYEKNLELGGFAERATTIVGYSQKVLRTLPGGTFDVIYIDGSHTADDVLADAVLSWELLKPGGILIFDDYAWSGYPGPHEPPTPDELRPKVAVDSFLTAYRNTLEILDRDFQVFVRRIENVCAWKEGCSPIGRYQYEWWKRRLSVPRPAGDTGVAEEVALTDPEKDALEAWLRARDFGEISRSPSEALQRQPGFVSLLQKTGLRP